MHTKDRHIEIARERQIDAHQRQIDRQGQTVRQKYIQREIDRKPLHR